MLVCLVLTFLSLLSIDGASQGEKVKLYLNNGKIVVGELLETTDDSLVLETDLGFLLVKKSTIAKRTKLITKVVKSKDPAKSFTVTKSIVERENPFTKLELPNKKQVALKTIPAPLKKTENKIEPESFPFATKQRPRPAPGSVVPPTRAAVEINPKLFYAGRLVDKYSWLRDLELPTLLSILFGLWVLFWYSIDLFARILDFEERSKARSALAATIWLALIAGITLLPNPTNIVAIAVSVFVLIAAVITARKVLEANWLQTIETLFLAAFGLFLVFLLVEVGQAVVEL